VKLTPLQRKALRVIISHQEKNGRPPSQGELAEALGVSKTAARWRLAKLAEAGAITRAPGVARGIEVYDPDAQPQAVAR
jgi:DNA-binding Lrp family transcriptional regulator